MIERFQPTWLLKTIYRVSPRKLKANGITVILSDLDNTLIAWNNPNGTRQLMRWNRFLKQHHILLVVVSNNTHHRVANALAGLKIHFVSWSLKPLSFGIGRALRRYHIKRSQAVMVGDQLMTDVWAANNSGIRSIWVKPLVRTDKWDTRINRFFERRIYRKLKKKNRQAMVWQGDLY